MSVKVAKIIEKVKYTENYSEIRLIQKVPTFQMKSDMVRN